MNKFYTGVGSRKTPANILAIMQKLAQKLALDGWILRSGGAKGADSAFEFGAAEFKNIYYANDANQASMDIAAKFHPAWDRCSIYVKKLHGRNSFQVLGSNLDIPSAFLVCWTQDACTHHASRSYSTGGTGTAISIAESYGVKIFNLANPVHLERILTFIN